MTGVSSTMTAAIAQLPTTNGHINLFEDLEHVCMNAFHSIGPILSFLDIRALLQLLQR